MKISILLFALTLSSLIAKAQLIKLNSVEVIGNDSLKVYLARSFQPCLKECAEYYMIGKADHTSPYLTGQIRGYYKNGKLLFTGTVINGEKHGEFKFYHANGQALKSGFFKNNQQDSIWNYYYSSNSLEKTVIFKDGVEYLKEYRDRKGQPLVQNFKGQYDSEAYNTVKVSVKGYVQNGRPDGEWQNYIDGVKIGTELFANGMFQKGFSYSSALGTQPINHSIITFKGAFDNLNLNFRTPVGCRNSRPVFLSTEFWKIFKENIAKQSNFIKKKEIWCLVYFEIANTKLKNIAVYSPANDFAETVKTYFTSIGSVEQYKIMKWDGYSSEFFPVIIKDGHIFTKDEVYDQH